MRGASRLDDWADSRWILTQDKDKNRYFSAIGRSVEVDEGKLAFDRDRLAYTYEIGGRPRGKSSQEPTLAPAIVAILEEHLTGLSIAEIRVALPDPPSNPRISKVLNDMKRDGTIVDESGEGRTKRWKLAQA